MTEPRFALDEHLPTALALGLVRRGIEAKTFAGFGRAGYPDDEQLAWANETDVVIVTHDDDYIVLARATSAHAGVAFCNANKYSLGDLIRALDRAVRLLPEAESWRGQVVFL